MFDVFVFVIFGCAIKPKLGLFCGGFYDVDLFELVVVVFLCGE